jgi:hypothetical protein
MNILSYDSRSHCFPSARLIQSSDMKWTTCLVAATAVYAPKVNIFSAGFMYGEWTPCIYSSTLE